MGWYLEALVNYANFRGRATRSEFWWFNFFHVVILMGLTIIVPAPHTELVLLFYVVATAVPSMAVTIRRLHDTDRSGWWLLLVLIPFGGLVLLLYYILDGTPGTNRYGPDPKTSVRGSGAALAKRTPASTTKPCSSTSFTRPARCRRRSTRPIDRDSSRGDSRRRRPTPLAPSQVRPAPASRTDAPSTGPAGVKPGSSARPYSSSFSTFVPAILSCQASCFGSQSTQK